MKSGSILTEVTFLLVEEESSNIDKGSTAAIVHSNFPKLDVIFRLGGERERERDQLSGVRGRFPVLIEAAMLANRDSASLCLEF